MGNVNGHCTFLGWQETKCNRDSCVGCSIWDKENFDDEDPRCSREELKYFCIRNREGI